ncbi:glycoside hydrolase family 44-domain-containing protein [Mycena epipterygia]|nr:glycoside hydrolase family 44-domain-containing protein [Mycena epipterygia]
MSGGDNLLFAFSYSQSCLMTEIQRLVALLATSVLADTDNALAAGWEDWSWSSAIDYAATDLFEEPFENRVANLPNADDRAGSESLLTVPALDWVAKDARSYSHHILLYFSIQLTATPSSRTRPTASSLIVPTLRHTRPAGNQSVHPVEHLYGCGQAQGAREHKPTLLAIDDEIETASNTHPDVHPYPTELAHVLDFSIAAKEAIPGVLVAAPSTCSWWYYWTSQIGYTDTAVYDNIGFLPWFLLQMAAAEKTHGKIAPDTSYVDESWISSSPQNHQWNLTVVGLIPAGLAYCLYRGFSVHFWGRI